MNSDCAFLKFADELLVKFVEFLPMKDRVNVRATCSRLEEIVAKTDLVMTRYIMQFYLFNGTPWSTPFGMPDQGIDANKMEEFLTARARFAKRIALSEVVLDKIDFETVDFALVRRALTDCSFEQLYIVQNNVEYNEKVETLIEEHRGKKIVFSALYFPYFQCIDQLSADIELRFNYLHRQKVPGPGKNEDLLINLLIKGHSICDAHWCSPTTVKEAFDVIALSKREQFVALKTFDLASFLNSIGVEKTEDGFQLRADEGAYNLQRIVEEQISDHPTESYWSFSHGDRVHVMTESNGIDLIWISNRPFQMLMSTCPMHCSLCESMKNTEGPANRHQLCDKCAVCRCVSFYRF